MFEIILMIFVIVLFVLFFNLKNDIKNLEKKIKNLSNFSSKNLAEKNPEKYQEKYQEKNPEKNVAFIVGEENFSPKSIEEEKIFQREKEISLQKKDFQIGSKIFPAIGILSILFGLGFFLKDLIVLTNETKILLGFLLGIFLIVLGKYIRKKFVKFSTFFIAGGIAALYTTEKFGISYEIYNTEVGFVLMVLTTFFALVLTYFLNSRAIGIISYLGGFLAPVLVASDSPNELVLFNYILLLIFSACFIIYKKKWFEILLLNFVGAISLYLSSIVIYYENNLFLIYIFYAFIYFLIFSISCFYLSIQEKIQKSIWKILNIILIISNLSFFMFIINFFFKEKEQEFLVLQDLYFLIALIPAILYIIFAKISLKRKNIFAFVVTLSVASFATAMIFPLQFSGNWITFAWILQSIFLLYIAIRQKIYQILYISAIVFFGAIVSALINLEWVGYIYVEGLGNIFSYTPVFNQNTIILLLLTLSAFIFGYIFRKKEKNIEAKIFSTAALLIFLFWIFWEISASYNSAILSFSTASTFLSICYILVSVFIMYVGIIKDFIMFRIVSIILFLGVILKTYLFDIWNLSEIWRVVAFVFLGVSILLVGYLYNNYKKKLKEKIF